VNDRLSNLESRVDRLAQQISDLERRMSALDRKDVAAKGPPPGAVAPESDLSGVFALVGRTLLALGGAYLLRALTEAGVLPQIAGVSLAAVYAGAWIFFADRAGKRGRATSAAFHIGAAVVVAYPLIWETTVRLQLLGPGASAAALVGFGVAILAVARRHGLEPGAWVGVVAAELTAVALLFGTRAVVPFVGALVVFGLATLGLWAPRSSSSPSLGWVSAAVADLAVVLLTLGALVQNEGLSIPAAISVQLALFLGYTGVCLRRNLVEADGATVFEMAQSAAATLVGFGGAAALAKTTPSLATLLFIGMAGAFAGFWAAFRSPSSATSERNRVFFSALALAIVLIATGASMAQPAWLWAVLAVLSFALGRRIPGILLSAHGSVYLVAAAAASGLLELSLWTLLAPSTASWPPFTPAVLLVLAAATASLILGVPEASGGDWKRWARLPRALALSVALLGGSAGALVLLTPLVSADADMARLAALRTAVLSLASLALAAVSRGTRLNEARPLSLALLVLCGIKLVVEDFPRGRPETLFLGLGIYGAALILAPRLGRRTP
jgi:hypothetical protein